EQQARVVIEAVEDLDHLASGQPPGGDVRLPALVGELGFKADQASARALLSLRGDEPLTPENAPDRRYRGNSLAAPGQVVGDRLGAGVVSFALKLAAQRHDRVDGRLRGCVLARARTSGARLKRL